MTLVEEFVGRPTLAGVLGWTLLVGYVGTIAMYGYAYGAVNYSSVCNSSRPASTAGGCHDCSRRI
ncbi:MAG: hypothetical protein ABEJ23_10650 [Haloarculaceae archaeon]